MYSSDRGGCWEAVHRNVIYTMPFRMLHTMTLGRAIYIIIYVAVWFFLGNSTCIRWEVWVISSHQQSKTCSISPDFCLFGPGPWKKRWNHRYYRVVVLLMSKWVLPKIGIPQNGWWKKMENPIFQWMIWGYPYFWKHPNICDSNTFTTVDNRLKCTKWFFSPTGPGAYTGILSSIHKIQTTWSMPDRPGTMVHLPPKTNHCCSNCHFLVWSLWPTKLLESNHFLLVTFIASRWLVGSWFPSHDSITKHLEVQYLSFLPPSPRSETCREM